MSEYNTSKKVHKDGASWKLVATCFTFEEADRRRQSINSDKTMQAKVRKRLKENNFTVHSRLNPAAKVTNESTDVKQVPKSNKQHQKSSK
jgi:hypothetical protein